MSTSRLAALLLVPRLVCPAAEKHRPSTTVHTASEAKAIAERETARRAVSARQIPLNGASGGWEAEVHMPKEDCGWRCIIDAATHMVYTKDRIPNPKAPSER